MRIIRKNRRVCGYLTSRYSLNSVPAGILLLYVLINDCGMSFKKLVVMTEDDPSGGMLFDDRWLVPDLDVMARMFTSKRIGLWELECRRDGVPIFITGRMNRTLLDVIMKTDMDIDLKPFMTAVEERTHMYI